MDTPRFAPSFKDRLTGLLRRPAAPAGSPVAGSLGQDRLMARTPLWRRFAVPGVALVVLSGLGIWALSGTGGNVIRVPLAQLTIGSVTRGPFEDYIAVRGAVAPLVTAHLTTDQGGTVRQVLVEDGAMVKAGQPLIVLSNPALQLQVAAQQLAFEQTRFKYQQDLLQVEYKLNKLKADLERDKILLDGNAIAPSTYKAEQEEYAYYLKLRAATMASHAMEQKVRSTQLTGDRPGAGANVANAGVEALTIRAPMDGQLSALDAEVGQSKASGAVLGQVNSADRFKLTAQVDEFYLGKIVIGQEARFGLDDREYRARIAKIYPQVSGGTFKVDLYFLGDAPGGIHVGQAVDLKVVMGNPVPALRLANGPFYQDTGGNWAFVLNADGRSASRRAIKLGRRNPEYLEVVEGLNPGERVIVSGYQAYLKMDRVEFEKVNDAR